MATFDYDVVIVGSGVAGALCAYELSRRGHGKILILEAGENGLGSEQRADFVRDYRLATIKSGARDSSGSFPCSRRWINSE